MLDIYFIGGSPCSGKSTVAEIISKKYDLYYFKVDDYLEEYMKKASLSNKEICRKAEAMTSEEIWMRDPVLQCKEELLIYKEIFEFISEDLKKIECKNGIITEGAAFLPELVNSANVAVNKYISITPTKDFQISHYKEREWVPYVLEGCSDKETAFDNWMSRDVLFAEAVRKQCGEFGYISLVNDGEISVNELVGKVISHFHLCS